MKLVGLGQGVKVKPFLIMRFLESNLEDIIFNTSNKLLNERGLLINGIKKRQVKIGNYGIADLITFERFFDEIMEFHYVDINIYELKKDLVGIEAFLQSIRYAKGLQSYLLFHRQIKYNFRININLLGNKVDTSHGVVYMPDLIDNESYDNQISCVKIYTYNYDFNGITFEEQNGYKLILEGFKGEVSNE